MIIGHLVHYYQFGGVETYTRDLFAELDRQGHASYVMSTGARIGLPEVAERFRTHPSSEVDAGPALDRDVAAAISEWLAAVRPDIVFVHSYYGAAILHSVALNSPVAYFAHSYGAFCPSGARYLRTDDSACHIRHAPNAQCIISAYTHGCNTRRPLPLLQSYRRTSEAKREVKEFDLVVCDSEHVRGDYAANGFRGDRIRVLPSPIVPPPDTRADYGRTILFAARLTPQKGLVYALRALQQLAGVNLLVAGDGYEMGRYRDLVSELALSDRVRFLGAIPHGELMALYPTVAAVVVPSTWPEPLGMVGLEAMSFGVPVVAFDSGGIRQWLEDRVTGFVVMPRDHVALAASLRRLVDDPELNRRMGNAGRTAVERDFGLRQHVVGLVEAFHDAIRHRQIPVQVTG